MKLADFDSDGEIYVDANIFIYIMLKNPRYLASCKSFLERVEKGEVNAVISPLVLDEIYFKIIIETLKAKFDTESGSCICDPQWYNCDQDFANGCEHQYACTNSCTYTERKYCYSNNLWNTFQSSFDCGMGNGLIQTCSAPTPKCYQSGSSASCVECLTNSDCPVSKPNCDTSTHTCYTPLCTACDSGATPCGSCSFVNPGKYCKNVNGAGKLVDDQNTCKGCVKYSARYGSDAGKGINKFKAEICLDSYVEGQGYTNWIVDEFGGSGAQIKETKCVNN